MNKEVLLSWLTLLRAPGIGAATLNPLLLNGFSPSDLLRQPPTQLTARQLNGLKNPDHAAAEKDLQWLEAPFNHLIPITSTQYPEQLKTLATPPIALFVHGDPTLLSSPQIAIVGSRNPTPGGKQTAEEFAQHLATSGLAITSGMAQGIDTAAHQGALAVKGFTIAVTGTGLDRVYPAENRELAYQIAKQGALVSEYPPGTQPRAGNFPRRNRIISGLSLGTLVVEAALKSGSLITARLAAEQSREVFAIPGSIHNPHARGCHSLIQQGAKLVETAQDVLQELAPALQQALLLDESNAQPQHSNTQTPAENLDADYLLLMESMGYDPVSINTLVNRTKFAVESVSSMLLLLEMKGHVSSAPGGLFHRTEKKGIA